MIATGGSARFTWHDAFVDRETKAHQDHAEHVFTHQAEALHRRSKRHWFQHLWG